MESITNIAQHIEKPLFVFDLETTGLDLQKDEIVQFSYLLIMPDGTHKTSTRLVKPSVKISEEAAEVHGITEETVKGEPSFEYFAQAIHNICIDCDVAGFNIAFFDLPILDRQLLECGFEDTFKKAHIFDAFKLFKIQSPRNLEAAVMHYTGKSLEGAHDAEFDVLGTTEVISKQLEIEKSNQEIHFNDICCKTANPPSERVGFSNHIMFKDGVPVFGFGKHKGLPLSSRIDYLQWMYRSDFPRPVHNFIEEFLKKESL